MGAIMEFATEKQIASFLSTCRIEGQKNFLMAFKKKTWLKSEPTEKVIKLMAFLLY